MFTYTQTDKIAEKPAKINIKKWKITETSRKTAQPIEQTETLISDTEEKKENPAILYNIAKKTLWNILSKINSEAKIKVKQALYHLKRA